MGIRSDPERSVKTADNVFELIDVMRRLEGGTVSEITDEVDLARSTVHAYLSTMAKHGYVDKKGDAYEPSLKFLELGIEAQLREPLTQASKPVAEEIAAETGEVAWIIVEEHGQAVYLLNSEGENAVQSRGRVGKRTSMHDIAAGKAILAHLPEERIESIIDSYGLPERTENTITDREDLYEELALIRDQGYAVNDGETIENLRAVASPIMHGGSVCGAVGIAGPRNRMTDDVLYDVYPSLLLEASDTIGLEMTYS
ncbi:IclR family transcriptional regulator [Haloarchaeobius amylolyticus]|uniref:IclR family transcriptional regulator n=1 Tax=Haloarchaeobius amylolyticus TaxID=1198296 RepID=A0ABD6BCW5_9EURY